MSEFTINMADAAAYSGIPIRSVMEVSLTGSEPLVRRDFMKIVDALLAGGIRITTIYSNGKLVTDKFLDHLAERGIHPEFNTSYDGLDGWHRHSGGVPADSGAEAGQVHHRFPLYAADRHPDH